MNLSPHQLLLFTTSAPGIAKHLDTKYDPTVSHWVMDADRFARLPDAPTLSWPPTVIVLINETITLEDEEEDFLYELLETRELCWVYHNPVPDFCVPKARAWCYFHEHGEEGSVAEFFFHWNYAPNTTARRALLEKYLTDSLERSLEISRRTYLNEFSDEALRQLGERFSQRQELNPGEVHLLERHPDLAAHLLTINPDAPPEVRHWKRLSIARYFYEKR